MRDVVAWIDAGASLPRLPCRQLARRVLRDLLAERYDARAVLINPSVRPFADLERYLGPQRNLYTGEEYELTPRALRGTGNARIERITRPERYFLLTQSGDEVLDWREAVSSTAARGSSYRAAAITRSRISRRRFQRSCASQAWAASEGAILRRGCCRRAGWSAPHWATGSPIVRGGWRCSTKATARCARRAATSG